MDMIFFSKSALYDSLINCFVYAMAAKKSGKRVGIVFTGDALNCLCTGIMRWPGSLSGMEAKKTISKEAVNRGIEISGQRDPREINIEPLARKARESGVMLYACPVWSGLLKLKDSFPDWIAEITMERLIEEIAASGKIIGGI